MLSMNVFKQDAFSAISLSAAIDRLDYVPSTLQLLPGLVEVDPVRTESIWIEDRSTGAVILPFSPRGAAPHQTGGDNRNARSFKTLRISDASRITASELLDIRRFGSEVDLKDLQTEVARRQFKMKRNFQITKEYHLFNLVTGALVKDADGSTKFDWAAEFGQTIPAALDFDLSNGAPATGAIRKLCTQIRRSIQINLKSISPTVPRIIGLCGDTFWDNLTSHPEVEKTFLNWSAAADLRNGHGQEWSAFRYGEIEFVNYRGTDDGSTLGVGAKNCKFFPVGAGIFKWALSPGEKFEHLGTLGQDMYSDMLIDKDRDQWADVEAYSYPLPICIQPSALHRATTP